jgi:hypothetical protein
MHHGDSSRVEKCSSEIKETGVFEPGKPGLINWNLPGGKSTTSGDSGLLHTIGNVSFENS